MANPALEALLARKETLEQILSRIDVWLLVFGVFVVIGVAGESVFGIRAWLNNRRLHAAQQAIDDFRQTEAALFNKQAADANRDAGLARKDTELLKLDVAKANERGARAEATAKGFEAQIADANARAAKANSVAEQERLERLQLEARLADRTLSPAQEKSLKAAFARLKGKTADVTVFGESFEITNISDKVMWCMKEAGMLLNASHPLRGSRSAWYFIRRKSRRTSRIQTNRGRGYRDFAAIYRQRCHIVGLR